MRAQDAAVVCAWRYDPPYDVYNLRSDDLAWLTDPANDYHVVSDGDDIAGYCCYGRDARVLGGDYADHSLLDVGLGMRPDLTGRGLGQRFVLSILDFGRARYAPAGMRLTVAAFNERAMRVYGRCGFVTGPAFTARTGMRFVVMTAL